MILCKLWRSSACRLSLWESRAFEATDHFNENTRLSGTGGFVLEGSTLGREETVYVGGTISAWAAPVAVGRFGWFGLAILAASLAAS